MHLAPSGGHDRARSHPCTPSGGRGLPRDGLRKRGRADSGTGGIEHSVAAADTALRRLSGQDRVHEGAVDLTMTLSAT